MQLNPSFLIIEYFTVYLLHKWVYFFFLPHAEQKTSANALLGDSRHTPMWNLRENTFICAPNFAIILGMQRPLIKKTNSLADFILQKWPLVLIFNNVQSTYSLSFFGKGSCQTRSSGED